MFVAFQSVVGWPFIGVDSGAGFNIGFDGCVQDFSIGSRQSRTRSFAIMKPSKAWSIEQVAGLVETAQGLDLNSAQASHILKDASRRRKFKAACLRSDRLFFRKFKRDVLDSKP